MYSLEPNGRTLDYRLTGASDDLNPIGVEKQSFEGGLFALGETTGSTRSTLFTSTTTVSRHAVVAATR